MSANWNDARGIRLRELDNLMPSVDLTIDAKSYKSFIKAFEKMPASIELALVESIKKTQRLLRSEVVKGLKKTTTLMPKYISRAVKAERIKQDGMSISGSLRIASKALPLIRFEVNPQTPPRLRGVAISARKRLSYRLEKGGKTFSGDEPTYQPHMQKVGGSFSKAFTQHTGSGHIGVFHRHKESGKMIQAFGPKLQFFMHDDDLLDELRQKGHDKFMHEFPREFKALTGIKLG